MQAGSDVGHGSAGSHRPCAGCAGHRHQPRKALCDLVEAWPVAVRTILAESGNAAKDDSRIHPSERFVVDPEPILDVGTEILDHDVGLGDQLQKQFPADLRLQVERQRALVAVQVLEVRAVARSAEIVIGGRFDLDHVGTEVGELSDAGRAGTHARQVEDTQRRERAGSLDGRRAGVRRRGGLGRGGCHGFAPPVASCRMIPKASLSPDSFASGLPGPGSTRVRARGRARSGIGGWQWSGTAPACDLRGTL